MSNDYMTAIFMPKKYYRQYPYDKQANGRSAGTIII